MHRQPTHENIKVIVKDFVLQEVIRKQKYIAIIWNSKLQTLKSFPEFSDGSNLYPMYEKNPTLRRVID